MSVLVSAGRRVLPRGYADFGRQLVIWFAFLGAYQLARGIADRNPPKAFENGLHVIGIEQHAHALRAQPSATGRRVTAPRDRGLVDVLELRVHRARPRAALGLPAAERGVHPLPQHDPARERDRPRGLRTAADGAAAHV